MGLNPGNKPRNLVDMSEIVQEFEYVPTSTPDRVDEYPIILSAETELMVREVHANGRVVDFSLNYFATTDHPLNEKDANCDIARIDCCHSEVHRHQFYRTRGEDKKYIVIKSLKGLTCREEAEREVHSCYDDCYEMMLDNCENYLERWEERP